MVERHHRRGQEAQELLVERRDLRPVGLVRRRRLGVQGRDRRLDLIATRLSEPQRPVQYANPFLDLSPVPARAVLVGQQDQLPLRAGTRGAARVVEQHQREQPERLGLGGHQRRQQLAQPQRLRAQLGAQQVLAGGGGVALVEDQVDDREHRVQAIGQRLVARQLERDARVTDLALRADQALAHGGVRHEERPRDLRRRQSSHGLESQRDPRLERERGMAAGEQQAETLVPELGQRVGETDRASRRARRRRPIARAPARSVRGLRSRSIARLRATVNSHAAGDCGVPSRPQRSSASANAS